MNIFLAASALLTGIGVFMTGVLNLRQSLQYLMQGKLKNTIRTFGKNRYKAAGVGATFAALMHSSGAVATLTIGLVHTGGLTLLAAGAVILGANIGTTIVGITAASGILGFGSALSLFVFFGILITLLAKKNFSKILGQAFIGLGLIFFGMQTMSNSFAEKELAVVVGQAFKSIKIAPMLVLFSALITAILQSSSSMVALTITMVASQTIPLKTALFIVLGADAGTCITAIIAGLGTTKDSKRAALIQLLFNVFGVVLFTLVLSFCGEVVAHWMTLLCPNIALSVSMFHLFFNLITVIIALPLLNHLIKLTHLMIK
ncbi:MAG: Na/Pi symporter [Clostridiales bacterium]|jgi:phosphate:Na+ symporter|nr:Na/Pi symporter [Clostridiales bacterium]